MRVQSLTLKNFRNLEEISLSADRHLNFVLGSNGQGKTSILEALSFLATLRSFREPKLLHCIQFGKQTAQIGCSLVSDEISQGEWKTDLKLVFEKSSQPPFKASKTAYINQKPYASSSEYLSQRFQSYEQGFHAIPFNPSDHDLVRGDPQGRRTYLDRVIAAEQVQYLKILQTYQRILNQRNALLKAHLKSSRNVNSSMLKSFTEQLCQVGARITYERLQWIFKTQEILNSTSERIVNRAMPLKLSYLSQWAPSVEELSFNNSNLEKNHFSGQAQEASLKLLEQSFWAKIAASEAIERRMGFCVVGPHRDDWTFLLRNQVLKGHGSQGEVRSALLALKLTEIESFKRETGHRPLFLMDDFSSELDEERRSFLLQSLIQADLQTFITTTEDSFHVGRRFWLCDGIVKEGTHDDRRKSTPVQ
ncbi:MAG: DNA replication/repair protein RecF [Bdellovibrionia bacterium]